MSLEGLWTYTLAASTGKMITGVMVICGGWAYGGSERYCWKGKLAVDGGRVTTRSHVRHYAGEPVSLFGPMREFHLVLEGVVGNEGMTLHGHMEGDEAKRLVLTCRKMEELGGEEA